MEKQITNRLLLDTHIFIWWMEGNKRLSSELKKALNDPNKLISLSVATIWEMIIKKSVGKLRYPPNLPAGIEASGFKVLSIKLKHVLELEKLPPHHKDPFDRILIAQSRAENLSLITADPKIWQYSVTVVKA